MADIPRPAVEHYELILVLQADAIGLARQTWRNVAPNAIDASFQAQLPSLVREVQDLRWAAALEGSAYGAFTLADQGTYVPPSDFTDIDGLIMATPNNGVVADELSVSTIRAKQAITRSGTTQGMLAGRDALAGILATMIADTARQASGVDLVTRSGIGYVRMLNPPSCGRCATLAGRFYRWNQGFARHPRCDCVHVQTETKSVDGAKAEGLIDDPYEYFESLSDAEQVQRFGKYESQAIRDGADIFQVVNARRGRKGMYTTEGTTKRGAFRRANQKFSKRATPELIYRNAEKWGLDREGTRALLRTNGYILPGGQNPRGSIRGQVEGYGQMGAGGMRRKASQAVIDARLSGVRQPGNLYTMTAAERRVADAEWAWREVQLGRNPWTSAATERRWGRPAISPDYPLTPDIAASVEASYRYWLARGGQIYTR
ncbi:hypothetical protein [Flaviflexus equikiangi]|uniref:Uncharacterized protein n=1 Tax=Flaviflexus equikiangi TaxID=2758573 RepID=A0ABS2TCI8_9ACTO|nr:hypothetical protein [Flaviflexus equikiangi]MBM9432346.1 hypothetical protein [Flaviflexus equikiangi]